MSELGATRARAQHSLTRAMPPFLCFMITVPFALIINSTRVVVTTQVFPDGTVLRQVSGEADTYFHKSLNKWTYDVEAGGQWEKRWRDKSTTRGTTTITRNFLTSHLHDGEATQAPQILDVFQKPLSIYTTYTWSERITLEYHQSTNPAEARAGGHYLTYYVLMPGSVTEARCTTNSAHGPAKTSAGRATFLLDAGVPNHEIIVTSRNVRWGYLAILAYILLFVLDKGIGALTRYIRSRPKRI
jgi:hypothetical protein